ncbi:MAG: zinc ABC transporter substrate-binding protein [Nocardioides sp.]
MFTLAGRRPTLPLLAGGAMAAALLSGCGASDGSTAGGASGAVGSGVGGGASSAAAVSIVASTDVWGDVAKQVAGTLAGRTVQITSFITDPAADPHSYEANTQNLLTLSKADVVVENGGGYDDFVDTMLRSARNSSATVLNAVAISGQASRSAGKLNEHVWYDFPTVQRVADRLAAALSSADPRDRATYARNAARFDRKLASLEDAEATIKRDHNGEGVAITEPVPLYMLQACGLVNRTPPEFSAGVEEGTDVSPVLLKQTEDLFTMHRVRLLAYNEQTSGPQTQAVLTAARANHVPVVPVTETLPSGQDYLSWMRGNLAAVRAALG